MKPDYDLCDVCGKPTKHRLHLTVDRRMDSAGSMDDILECFDLCAHHAVEVLQEFANVSHDNAGMVATRIKAGRARAKKGGA